MLHPDNPLTGRSAPPSPHRRRRRRVLAGAAVLAGLGAAQLSSAGPASAATTSASATPIPAVANAPAMASASVAGVAGQSYSMVTSASRLIGFGAAIGATPPPQASPAVGVAATADGHGAWVAEANGAVVAIGDAVYHGSMAGVRLNQPVVGIAADPATGGYWLVAADGGVFSFNAPFLGSTGALRLARPVVGVAATPDGGGYRLVASDGGIFDFGDARFYGSAASLTLARPVVGMAATPDGGGYRLVASDGGIFDFGDARFYGSTGNLRLNQPVVGMATTRDGGGYWLVAADGGLFTFGDAAFYGSAAGLGQKVVGMAVEAGGYQNPLRAVAGLTPERVDQGVDYAGSGPIYAIGDGVVLNTTNAGWPGGAFISYRLVDGPAQGDIVYVAENVVPWVAIGQRVNAATVLGILINAYPNLETGWAAYPGTGESAARAAGQWSSYDDSQSIPTAYGENFSRLLAALGAPPGLNYGAVVGSLPAGWPNW